MVFHNIKLFTSFFSVTKTTQLNCKELPWQLWEKINVIEVPEGVVQLAECKSKC